MMTKLIIWEYFKRTRLLFLVKENGKFFFLRQSLIIYNLTILKSIGNIKIRERFTTVVDMFTS